MYLIVIFFTSGIFYGYCFLKTKQHVSILSVSSSFCVTAVQHHYHHLLVVSCALTDSPNHPLRKRSGICTIVGLIIFISHFDWEECRPTSFNLAYNMWTKMVLMASKVVLGFVVEGNIKSIWLIKTIASQQVTDSLVMKIFEKWYMKLYSLVFF